MEVRKDLFYGLLFMVVLFVVFGTFVGVSQLERVGANRVVEHLPSPDLHPRCIGTQPPAACTPALAGTWSCTNEPAGSGQCVWRCNCVDRNGDGVYQASECAYNQGFPAYCPLGCASGRAGGPPRCA